MVGSSRATLDAKGGFIRTTLASPVSVEEVVDMLRVVARRALAEEELQEGGAEAVDLVQDDARPGGARHVGERPGPGRGLQHHVARADGAAVAATWA